MIGIVLGGFFILVVFWIIALYNGLITKRNRVHEAYSQIDVQLKRRSSLIPNLVETVKGYIRHEKSVLEGVTKARAAYISAKDVKGQAEASNQLTGALKSLFAVAEAYPDLKASQNFRELQEELSDTETKIAAARQFYNTNVLDYNTSLQSFPSSVFANMLKFLPEEYFKASIDEKADIKVSI